MKVDEFTQNPDKQLLESLQKEEPDLDSEVLLEMIQTHRDNDWYEPIDAEEYLRQLQSGERLC